MITLLKHRGVLVALLLALAGWYALCTAFCYSSPSHQTRLLVPWPAQVGNGGSPTFDYTDIYQLPDGSLAARDRAELQENLEEPTGALYDDPLAPQLAEIKPIAEIENRRPSWRSVGLFMPVRTQKARSYRVTSLAPDADAAAIESHLDAVTPDFDVHGLPDLRGIDLRAEHIGDWHAVRGPWRWNAGSLIFDAAAGLLVVTTLLSLVLNILRLGRRPASTPSN